MSEPLTAVRLETATSRAFGMGFWVYLLGEVLVDSGFAHARPALLRALSGRRIARIAHTHVHEDHVGNDAAVAAAFGATVLAPRRTLHLLADPSRFHLLFYERLIWGVPDPCPGAEPLGSEVDTTVGRLQVVPTPGHAPDHVTFFDPERRWLFSGDLFLGTRIRSARPFENMADLAESLRRVIALAPRRLLCAHRGAIDDPLPALEAKLRFVDDLRQRVAELRAGGMPARAIATRVLGRESVRQRLLTMGDVSPVKMVHACLKAPGEGYRQAGSVEY